MRNPDKCKVEYCGFKSPRSFQEVQFEILGLKNLIKKAEERMSMLEQSSFLAELAAKENYEDLDAFFEDSEDQ
tara:strand:- start:322 stop:540 length:219 start_codon:yes stop_codon:yes gene_type:complete